jgi:intracellular sulfur oxidation DsrE/DsrF family protein
MEETTMKLRVIFGIALFTLGLMIPPLANAAPSDLRPLVKVDANARYKAVYDIHSADTAAGISKGLFYARGLIEAFGKQGVKPAQLDIHLVMHGEAAQFMLLDGPYQKAVDDPFAVNYNAKITQDLLDRGVHVEICHSVMKAKGWKPEDVLPDVTIVHDGYTRLIQLQNDGYAYIGGF